MSEAAGSAVDQDRGDNAAVAPPVASPRVRQSKDAPGDVKPARPESSRTVSRDLGVEHATARRAFPPSL